MKKYLAIIVIVGIPLTGQSQTNLPFGDSDEYYVRILQISGITDDHASYHLRPYYFQDPIEKKHPWSHVIRRGEDAFYSTSEYFKIDLFEPVLFQSFNTALPRATKDGPIWQGKGYNSAFSMGAEISAGPLHIRFRPVAGMAQNRAFDLGPYEIPRIRTEAGRIPASEFAYRDFRGSIDYVQRYGDDVYSWFDLGDSSIQLRHSGFRLALSNQQIWTGPAVNTSLHFGYSAPGFRHLYAGTYEPLKTVAGSFEFAYIFGEMRESDYFSTNRMINNQSVNSLIFVYSPGSSNRFSIGAIRSYFHPYPDSFSEYRRQAKKLFEPGLRNALVDEDGEPRGSDPDNQIGSIFFRYYLPENGIEFYGEYGRNDHNGDWRDFRAQPNHHRAYTIGLTKTLSLPQQRLMAINLEINQLEAMRTALTRGNRHLGGWYTHGAQVIGIANNGQITGTGYGPGVNMQMIKADIFDPAGSLSFKLARIAYHNSRVDQYFDMIQEANSDSVERWEVRNIELMIGAELTAFLKYGIEITAAIDQSFIMNHHNITGNDLTNTRISILVRKEMRGWRR